MTNITFSVDDDLHRRMKKHPEIKWTEILRKSIREYLEEIERPYSKTTDEIAEELGEDFLIFKDEFTHEEDLEYQKKIAELEKERLIAIKSQEKG